MKFIPARSLRTALIALAAFSATTSGHSQFAYGVDAAGTLFSLHLATPTATSTIGNLGFVPEGIDFLPGTSTLFAIDIGASVSRLYTVDLGTGAATGVGAGFATAGTVGGVSYSLLGAESFGFDFNPTTLQPDGSIRIRLTASNGTNLRLNSATGGIAAVDGGLAGTIGGVAYINTSMATIGGITALYDIDYLSDSLFLQNPPNAGTLNLVGALGFNVGRNLGFDIFTNGGDATILGDTGYFVDTTAVNSATLYALNLGTGAATPLGAINRDFTGGFAIAGAVPEPSTYGLGAAALLIGVVAWRRRAKATVRS
jgi:hypothetical protein